MFIGLLRRADEELHPELLPSIPRCGRPMEIGRTYCVGPRNPQVGDKMSSLKARIVDAMGREELRQVVDPQQQEVDDDT